MMSANQLPARHEVECAELLSVMQEQENICKRLLELSQSERVALSDGRIDDLERTTAEKAGLVSQMERLESKRRNLAHEIAMLVGLSGDNTLMEIATRLKPKDADLLLRVRTNVMNTVSALRDSNDTNLALMRKSLDLVKDSIKELRRSTSTGSSYDKDGKASSNARSNLMVDRLA
ncbi:MAG: flagellar protein FlgN [Chloroflexota bacterium]